MITIGHKRLAKSICMQTSTGVGNLASVCSQPVIASATGPNGSFVGAPSASSWVFKTPTGLRSALNWLSARYSHPEFWVVENGVAVPGEAQARPPGVLNDTFRQEWIR